MQWDPTRVTGWAGELDGADVVINLAGRSVNCRYTRANRDEILRSRVVSVRTVGHAIAAARRPPPVWLQASTATIYPHRYDGANDETSGVVGGIEPGAPDTWRFSIEVATAWESALDEASTPGTRKVKLRSAMIMSPDTGGYSTPYWDSFAEVSAERPATVASLSPGSTKSILSEPSTG